MDRKRFWVLDNGQQSQDTVGARVEHETTGPIYRTCLALNPHIISVRLANAKHELPYQYPACISA